jgi:hypothetical protein
VFDAFHAGGIGDGQAGSVAVEAPWAGLLAGVTDLNMAARLSKSAFVVTELLSDERTAIPNSWPLLISLK